MIFDPAVFLMGATYNADDVAAFRADVDAYITIVFAA
jgi:hypothetical protein